MLTRPIRWDLIAQQYDQMIRYATAIRLGTADTETILRRFTSTNVQHPTYRALHELTLHTSSAWSFGIRTRLWSVLDQSKS